MQVSLPLSWHARLASPWDRSDASSVDASCQKSASPSTPPIKLPGVFSMGPCPLSLNQLTPRLSFRIDQTSDGVRYQDQLIADTLIHSIHSSPHSCPHRGGISSQEKSKPLLLPSPVDDCAAEIRSPLAPTNIVPRFQPSTSDFSWNLSQLSLRAASSPAWRSLTRPSDALFTIMNTTVSAPGSPPDLSGSRSSKSSTSSSESSRISNADGIASDITNFEDIGLDDIAQSLGGTHVDQLKDRRLANANYSGSPQRYAVDTTSTSPPTHNRVRVSGKRRESESALKTRPHGNTIQRGFTSPVTTFSRSNADTTRARSTSPLRQSPREGSTTRRRVGHLDAQWSINKPTLALPIRRGSWQPQRKTVRELEAEYHDSDDDLPEDTSLWNVPVSPFPSGDLSQRSSCHGSPTREPLPQSPGPIPLEHVNSAPDSRRRSRPKFVNSYRQTGPPRSTSLGASMPSPASPGGSLPVRKQRTKSWNLAMADLSEEARIISETLEYHAKLKDNLENTSYVGNQFEDNSSWVRSSKSSNIQLPPVQRGALDFMPISKEKEAILSRTRPSWLPPKDPKEEKKHIKEYQRMMAASMEADRKRQEKLKSQQCEKDNTRESLDRIWQYYIAETTDLATMDTRVYDLCWRGISPKLRGKVWQRGIRNDLSLSTKSYEQALHRAKSIRTHPQEQLNVTERSIDGCFKDIERDAETAFPNLNLFQRNGPMWQNLIDVCEAYACYRSDVGYVYGIQLVAALLLLQVPTPADAFILLANCLNRPIAQAFHTRDSQAISRAYDHVVSTLAVKHPRLHEYLFGSLEQGCLGFTAEEIFDPMFRTLFCNGLDLDRLCRVWDIWVFEGDKALVHTAVAVLGSLQSQLFDIEGDVDLKRRNIQEMLGWGPYNRSSQGIHWKFPAGNDEQKFADDIRLAGTLDYRGK